MIENCVFASNSACGEKDQGFFGQYLESTTGFFTGNAKGSGNGWYADGFGKRITDGFRLQSKVCLGVMRSKDIDFLGELGELVEVFLIHPVPSEVLQQYRGDACAFCGGDAKGGNIAEDS